MHVIAFEGDISHCVFSGMYNHTVVCFHPMHTGQHLSQPSAGNMAHFSVILILLCIFMCGLLNQKASWEAY